MIQDFALNQGYNVMDHIVELQPRLLRGFPPGEHVDTPDDFARAPTFRDHMLHAGPHLLELRRPVAEPSQAGFAGGHDCTERLAYFVGDGCTQFSKRCYASCMS